MGIPVGVMREAIADMIVHRVYRHNVKSTVEIRPSDRFFLQSSRTLWADSSCPLSEKDNADGLQGNLCV